MNQHQDWRARRAAIIDPPNDRDAHRTKLISHNTRAARRQSLFRMFALLRRLGFTAEPEHLGERHVAALVHHWCAEQVAGAPCRPEPCSAAYIQQQLSILRVYAGWIGKPGLVRGAGAYAADAAMVARHYPAERDRRWEGSSIDPRDLIGQVAAIDRHVGVQLRLMLAFGMRRKEAVMFWPHVAEVPSYALPGGHPAAQRFVSFLRIKRGTKGGHLRYTAVRSDEQRDALDEARLVARRRFGHVGRPGLSLKQSLDRFSNVVRAVGMTRGGLGVTAHGLRHQFANDLYFEIARVRSPVRGGDPALDPAVRRDAYRQVAEQLGHHRPQISTAYLGSMGMKGGTDDDV
jgi:integrase